jgi:hypothetical protein
LRWGDRQKEIRAHLGQEFVVLAFTRQTFRVDSVGGINDVGTELAVYVVRTYETSELSPKDRSVLFDMSRFATVRVRPVDSPLLARAAAEEERLINDLRRPSEQAIRQGVRYAVWPILALHISP